MEKLELEKNLSVMKDEISKNVEAVGYSKFLKETGEHLPSPSRLSKYLTFDLYSTIPRGVQVRIIHSALLTDNELVLSKLREFGVFTNQKVTKAQKVKAAQLANMYYDKMTNDQKSEVFFAKYGQKGTWIHELMETYFDTDMLLPMDEKFNEFKGNYDAAKNFIEENVEHIEAIGSEIDVWDKELGLFGRLDFLCYWDGKLTIVDWKTNTELITNITGIQLYVYKRALENWGIKIDDIKVIKLQKDGTYKIHTYDKDWYPVYEKIVTELKSIHDFKQHVKTVKM